MSEKPVILWFRRDLRLSDHPALADATALNRPIIPVYIHAPEDDGTWPPGAASRWWLHRSLVSLRTRLKERGLDLVFKTGPTVHVLKELAAETGATALCFNRRIEPAARQVEATLATQVKELEIRGFHNDTLFEPGTVLTRSGQTPYKVFTPFCNACREAPDPPRPNPLAKKPRPFSGPVSSVGLDALNLMPETPWHTSLAEAWEPGEPAAQERLSRFVTAHLADYPRLRDRPDIEGTSQLSPHLHFGEISIRQVWWAVYTQPGDHAIFLKELLWREFARHVLYFFPHTPDEPFDPRFRTFIPRTDPASLKAWQRGQTGYPVVDAAMRQLWATGWMHNRMRMVVASFLFKDLRIDWREGARWFWDTLVDADLANNTLGWQWSAGCGVDAAPYFRIFNPVSQGTKFDPQGRYVRQWVPETAALPDAVIHQPWSAPESVLQEADLTLGKTYPHPITDHRKTRLEALKIWERIRS